jgi:L-lactate dehydrogenase complex protein LldF
VSLSAEKGEAAGDFRARAAAAMDDANLQNALNRLANGFALRRGAAVAGLPEFEALKAEAQAIKNHALDHLDHYLERFEREVVARGGIVHWCPDAESARQTVLAICREAGARTVTKGKSMVTEEIGLNPFLEANGIEPVETDLGEYLIQIAGQPPSHIIGPALHMTRGEVETLFRAHHGELDPGRDLEQVEAMVAEARQVLRPRYFAADVGITGANFLVAETGSTVIVTNEGNGDLTQSLPRVHVVVSSIEKVVPSHEDAATLLRVLARSATGQDMSVYTTFSCGPRRPGDVDGPDAFHVVLLDNGRSAMLGTEFQEMLRCIKCGACMNHCPVYGAIGGHAYDAVYMGPMGAVLTPQIVGLHASKDLPAASTFCGRCAEVCPMGIPLPDLMRRWRERSFETGESAPTERWGVRLWAAIARRPWAYRLVARAGAALLARLGPDGFAKLPLTAGWTAARDMPAPAGRTFSDLWAEERRHGRR